MPCVALEFSNMEGLIIFPDQFVSVRSPGVPL